jgi:hypothetical protein
MRGREGGVRGIGTGLHGSWAGLAALLAAGAAQAHHPGSHAARQADGRVRIEAVAVTPDPCSTIAEIRPGPPPAVTAPAGSAAVTVRLKREGEACAAAVSAARSETVLDIPASARQILLYVVAPDGSPASSERVPIR